MPAAALRSLSSSVLQASRVCDGWGGCSTHGCTVTTPSSASAGPKGWLCPWDKAEVGLGRWIAALTWLGATSLYPSPRPGDAGAEPEQRVGWEGLPSPGGDARCRGKGEWCWPWVALSPLGNAWPKVILKKPKKREVSSFPSSSEARGGEVMERLGSRQDVLPARRNRVPGATARLFLAGSGRGEASAASAPPAPLSSRLSHHILSRSGCCLRSRGVSRSGSCIPEPNVALDGKSAPDVAEPPLLQCHEPGWGPGRAWGHGDSRRDLQGGRDPSARSSWRGLSHPSGSVDVGTVRAGCSPGRGDGGFPTLGDSHWAVERCPSIGLSKALVF